jgi:UDP-N-acetyl-D-mannosaminouronate:lipid I N-acetyl-D-mannosaminouronosyltransferase
VKKIESHLVGNIPVNLYKSIEEAVEHIICDFVGKASSAAAINPEKIILARSDPKLKDVLLANEVRYSDGIGIVKLLEKKSGKTVARIPGCELWEKLMKAAADKSIPVFLVGASEDVLLNTEIGLKAKYGSNIVGICNGFFNDENELINNIKSSGAKIVTVAMGSPKQELFIDKCKNAGIQAFFMGVGGTYNVFTGNVKRAPIVFCDLGLEWFYRLVSQPSRIGRQRNLVKYLWLALSNKL